MATGKATTTGEVVHSPMTEKEFIEAYLDRMERAGWLDLALADKDSIAEVYEGCERDAHNR
jgi:hypothetical protein